MAYFGNSRGNHTDKGLHSAGMYDTYIL